MSTTVNLDLTSCFRDPQSALTWAFQQKNIIDFKNALDRGADVNLTDKKYEVSLFNKILQTSNSAEFIKICSYHGAEFYKVDRFNKYPIHYVIDSLCPLNVGAFLLAYDLDKINLKYYGENSLHLLIKCLDNDRYENVSKCIKLLLRYGCDPNSPNEKSQTAFHLLLKKQPKLNDKRDLVDYCLEFFQIDLYTYREKDNLKMMQQNNPEVILPERLTTAINFEFMLNLLRNKKWSEFEANFKAFKTNSGVDQVANGTENNINNTFIEQLSAFLEVAVVNGLDNTVQLLIDHEVDINKNTHDNVPPAFVACRYGYYKILENLIKKQELKFCYDKQSLMHEVCKHFGSQQLDALKCDYQKCFELLLEDARTDLNAQDSTGSIPLHYAVRYKNDAAVLALMQKSSYIGMTNNYHQLPIDEINSKLLEQFLDTCISTNEKRTGDDEHEIMINYKFLMSPRTRKSGGAVVYEQEIAPLDYIGKNSELKGLMKHPVLSSFLYLKWYKLNFLFVTNLLVFSMFFLSLICYIVLCYTLEVKESGQQKFRVCTYAISILGAVLLTLRELMQFFMSWKKYFRNFTNVFEIIFILLTWTILLVSGLESDTRRVISAITILMAAFELLMLIGSLPILSISTHMVILKKVSVTFLKSIALYSILLIAFALCFYTLFGAPKPVDEIVAVTTVKPLNDTITFPNRAGTDSAEVDEPENNFNKFNNPGIAIIKTFVMLTGEFDAGDISFKDPSYYLIFLLFVFLITIVLFNLLNALAISDTQQIKNESELTNLLERIKVLRFYEENIFGDSSNQSCCSNFAFMSNWLKGVVSIFPIFPLGRIVIRPNQRNEILVPTLIAPNYNDEEMQLSKLDDEKIELCKTNSMSRFAMNKYSNMDKKIMKRIKHVLSSRSEEECQQKEADKLWTSIRNMEHQLNTLTEFIIKNNQMK